MSVHSPRAALARFVAAAALALTCLAAAPAEAAGGFDLKDWLRRPGVRMVALEFYATWCGPCMKAVPRWKELHEKYRQQGLRLVVVNTQDPEGGCSNPGWNPDDVICDEDGLVARQFGVGSKLPAAFLWSWQGNMLVRNGHVDEVERAVEGYLTKTPRIVIERGKGLEEDTAIVLREKLADSGKLVIVAGDEERKAIATARKKQLSARYDTKLACEMGKEVPANALLKAVRTSGRTKRLMLSLVDLEGGCQLQAATAIWNDKRPSLTVAEAVDKLLGKLRNRTIQMPRGGGRGRPVAVREVDRKPGDDGWSPAGAGNSMHVVRFESNPPGAMVSLDGAPLCQTPCSQAVAAGPHKVTMAAVGFVPKEEVLGINADQKLDWKLPKDAGVLEIVTKDPNVSVPVTVDGKEVGVTPLTGYELRPGPHVIVAGDPKCSSPHEIQLVVERGQERKVEVEPVVRPAGLYITAKDSRGNIVRGEVWVDGKLLGKTLEAVKVPVCARQAEVRTEKHGSATVDLSLREKETARMDVRLAGGGVEWVRLAGGVFTMGTKSGGSSDERPTHEVDLDPFELARTETTVAQYEKCVDEGRCSKPRSSRKTDNYGKSDRKDHPVNAVTFSQAEAFCSFVGGRLPTEAEWEFASRSGGKDTKYPWGSAEPSCDRMVMKESGKPNGCGKKMTAPVCSRPQGNTEQGLCDMGGNVWEWTSDWYGESYYRDSPRTNPPGPASGTERSLRGGMWFGPGERARNGNRYKDKPSTEADGLGFRCARDVGPRRRPEGGGVVAGLEPPQACGMKRHSANFGPVQVGTQVKLGSHRPVKGSRFWDEKMMQYVGRTAKVKKLDGVDPQGCPRVKVDVDGGVYWWRVRDLEIVGGAAAGVAVAGGGQLPDGRFTWGTWCFQRESGGLLIKNSKSSGGNVSFNLRESSNGWYWVQTEKGKFVMWSTGKGEPQSFSFSSYSCGGPEVSAGSYALGNWTLEFPPQGSNGDKLEIRHASQTHTPRLWRKSNGWADFHSTGTKVGTWYSTSDVPAVAAKAIGSAPTNTAGASGGGELPQGRFKWGTYCFNRTGGGVFIKNSKSRNGTVRFNMRESSNGWYWFETNKGKYVMWSSGKVDKQSFTFDSYSCGGPEIGSGTYKAGQWTFDFPPQGTRGDKLEIQHASQTHTPRLWRKSNGWADYRTTGTKVATWYSATDATRGRISGQATRVPLTGGGTGVVVGSSNNSGGSGGSQGGPYGFASNAPRKSLPFGSFRVGTTWCARRSNKLVSFKNEISPRGVRFILPETSNGWYWVETKKGQYVMWSSGTSNPQTFTFPSTSCAGTTLSRGIYSAGEWEIYVPGNVSGDDRITFRHKSKNHAPLSLWYKSNGWADWKAKGGETKTIYSTTDPSKL